MKNNSGAQKNTHEVILTAESLEAFCTEVFETLGMTSNHAKILANQLVWAEMRGYPWLGVKKVLQYGKRLETGATNVKAKPFITSEGDAFVHFDGQNSFGQISGEMAMSAAIKKAEKSGSCIAVVKDTGSAFCLGYFVEKAARERMIGLAINNGPPLMPVFGGAEKRIGNQAFAIGAPAGVHPNLNFDTALSAATLVRLHKYQKEGGKMPPGLGLDAKGRPTTDPTTALAGMLLPIAGHRGSGMAIMWEVLTGVLSNGERFMTDVTMPDVFDRPQATSMFFLAINPEKFLPYSEFIDRVDEVIDRIHASKRAEGVDRIFAPGEQGAARAEKAGKDGVLIDNDIAAEVAEYAHRIGVSTQLFDQFK